MSENLREGPPDGGEKKYKDVFTVVDLGPDKKSRWIKLGVAFENRDQSWNVRLDGYPVNGTLQIRDHEPWEERQERFGAKTGEGKGAGRGPGGASRGGSPRVGGGSGAADGPLYRGRTEGVG